VTHVRPDRWWLSLIRKRAKRAIIASQSARRVARLARIPFDSLPRSGQALAAQRTLARDKSNGPTTRSY